MPDHDPLTTNGGPPALVKKARMASDHSLGLWRDIITMRWMTVPESSLKILLVPAVLWCNWEVLTPQYHNPFQHLLFISNRVPDSPPDAPMYAKSYYDITFVLYYIILFSFVRQALTIHVLQRMARKFGIKNRSKIDRFGEEGYAFLYFGCFGAVGVYVMSQLPTWWYKTEWFWLTYPNWQMTPVMKSYYLLQTAYWCQQLLVLVLRLEKPRKDFVELVIHHIVAIWLIMWSYLMNQTHIGNAVYVSMDIPDVLLALSKMLNYLQLETLCAIVFAIFTAVWTYFRHWINLRILWSVLVQSDSVPDHAKFLDRQKGVWMPPWMKYQIAIPLVLLHMVNLFWYYAIWRILFKAVFGSKLADDRSDDEDEPDKTKKE